MSNTCEVGKIRKMLSRIAAVIYFLCKQIEGSESWNPIKGDLQSGSMPDLQNSLGTAFWYPNYCLKRMSLSTDINFHIERKSGRSLLGHKQKVKRKKRIPGWERGKLKIAQAVLDKWLDLLDNNATCAFDTRECYFAGTSRYKRVSQKSTGLNMKYVMTVDTESLCSSKISVPRGSWGKCAFIASGAVLLRRPSGREIDAHDTVIRLGHMPLEGWSEYVGKKTTVLIGRGSIQSRFAMAHKDLKYLIGKDSSTHNRDMQILEKSDSVSEEPKLVSMGKVKAVVGDPNVADILYSVATKPINGKSRGPTTGFGHLLRIILSKFCTELDIYGMSPNCGGYYYDLRSQMKLHHSCEFESWVLHYLMKACSGKTKLCVFV